MDEWYFPRTELTQRYLMGFDTGISSTLAIHAPRRKGKTLFLLKDLAHEAQSKHYFPVYVNFWRNINAPHAELIRVTEEALAAFDDLAVLDTGLAAYAREARIESELLAEREIKVAVAPLSASSAELEYMTDLLEELEARAARQGRTMLLLVDEAQHMATTSQFDALTYWLRTQLDIRQEAVKAIFAGSSRQHMEVLLRDRTKPFYRFMTLNTLPDLNQDYIEFVARKLADDHGRVMPSSSLQAAFESTGCSPFWLMKVVEYVITQAATVEEALEHVIGVMEAMRDLEMRRSA